MQALEDARAEARTRLTERQRALALEESKRDRYREHHPELAALAPQELDSRLTALEAHCRTLDEQLFQCRARWPRRRRRPLKRAPCRRNWLPSRWRITGSASDLIGSASGASCTFAQSLTLERAAEANAQLAELSPLSTGAGARHRSGAAGGGSRHGDEVRSVDSLSGGESFLVSLALALALSSLSSRQTQVESLFIDEGFGTLDPDSLDLALSSLDSLQAAGRQIGVISHVQTLVERIGVQVRVEALGGGESRVVLP